MTNYKLEQEKQDKEFEGKFIGIYQSPHVLNTFAGLSDKATPGNLKSYLLSRDTALLEAFKKDVGEMIKKGNEWATHDEVESIKWKIHYGGYKEAVNNILSLLKDYNLNK